MALGNWPSGLAWALGAIGVVTVAMAAGVAIPRLHPLFADERILHTTGAQVAHKSLVEVPLGTVLLEEVVFRSVLLGLLTTTYGTVAGVLGSAFFFGLWHILPALEMHDSHSLTSQLGSGVWAEAGDRRGDDPGNGRGGGGLRPAGRGQRQRPGADGPALGDERPGVGRCLARRADPGPAGRVAAEGDPDDRSRGSGG